MRRTFVREGRNTFAVPKNTARIKYLQPEETSLPPVNKVVAAQNPIVISSRFQDELHIVQPQIDHAIENSSTEFIVKGPSKLLDVCEDSHITYIDFGESFLEYFISR